MALIDLDELTPHVSILKLMNATRSNIYAVREDGGHTLVDPGPVGAAPLILALDRRGELRLSRVVLTHAHPAHAGSAARVSRGTGVPAFVHPADAPFVDGREAPLLPSGRRGQLIAALGKVVDLCPPLYRVELLEPGVPVGNLIPIATPGHTPGSVCLLDRRDGALLSGDAVLWDGERCHLPEESTSHDPAAARVALRALLDYPFDALLPGHGPPLLRGARREIEKLLSAARWSS